VMSGRMSDPGSVLTGIRGAAMSWFSAGVSEASSGEPCVAVVRHLAAIRCFWDASDPCQGVRASP